MTSLSGILKADLSFKGKYRFKVGRQHYANIKNELARHYNNNKEKMQIKDDKGKVWLLADFSLKVDELEAVSPEKADIDYKNVIERYFNDIRSGVVSLPSEIDQRISKLVLLQEYQAENIKTHFEVLNGIKDAIKELREEIRNRKV
jgi:uncharacterized protein YaeQ